MLMGQGGNRHILLGSVSPVLRVGAEPVCECRGQAATLGCFVMHLSFQSISCVIVLKMIL